MRTLGKHHFTALLTILLLFSIPPSANAQNAPAPDNSNCLQCHAHAVYAFYNDWSEATERRLMNPHYRIDTLRYQQGTHASFLCTDCHSEEYSSFPHPAELTLEAKYICMDCHGGDEKMAHFHFEIIEEEFYNSVHSPDKVSNFSCWSCHDPHGFTINIRTGRTIPEIVARGNAACINCHSSADRFLLMAKEQKKDLIKSHEWLPNQELHFNKVRCLECHSKTHDSLLSQHLVLPAEQAVNNCAECHSSNSLLMSTLYKYQVISSRKSSGFLNSIILNESYVCGANRNYFLNWASIGFFALTLLGISIHALFRYFKN